MKTIGIGMCYDVNLMFTFGLSLIAYRSPS
jgi:hypothetical protein